jgi:hypothetical protein
MVKMAELVEVLKHAPYRMDPETGETVVTQSGDPRKRGLLRIVVRKSDDPAPRKGDKGVITRIQEGGLEVNADFDKERAKIGLPPLGSGERSWGVRIPNTPLVEHKGNHYLTARPTTPQTGGAVGTPLTTRYVYTQTGEEVPPEEVDRIVFSKADGTPLKKAPKSGYWEWALAKMDYVKVTLEGETFEYAPEEGSTYVAPTPTPRKGGPRYPSQFDALETGYEHHQD